MNLKIMIVGVGGQGTLLASRVLGDFALKNNLDCKLSEVHGMAQRGGSVVTYVTIADKVYSPIIEEGEADIVLSFERLEALRYANYVKKDGVIVVNNQEIMPMPVVVGSEKYPDDITQRLNKYTKNIYEVNALKLAEEAGSIKALNIVMLGALAKKLNLDKETFLQSVISLVPQKLVEVNKIAFEKGYNN